MAEALHRQEDTVPKVEKSRHARQLSPHKTDTLKSKKKHPAPLKLSLLYSRKTSQLILSKIRALRSK